MWIKKLLRSFLWLMAALIILLAATNPGMQRFRETSAGNMGDEQRVANYFLFSLYQRVEDNYSGHFVTSSGKYRYVGILLNFYQLKD